MGQCCVHRNTGCCDGRVVGQVVQEKSLSSTICQIPDVMGFPKSEKERRIVRHLVENPTYCANLCRPLYLDLTARVDFASLGPPEFDVVAQHDASAVLKEIIRSVNMKLRTPASRLRRILVDNTKLVL